jgi:hypothetical protein
MSRGLRTSRLFRQYRCLARQGYAQAARCKTATDLPPADSPAKAVRSDRFENGCGAKGIPLYISPFARFPFSAIRVDLDLLDAVNPRIWRRTVGGLPHVC